MKLSSLRIGDSKWQETMENMAIRISPLSIPGNSKTLSESSLLLNVY